MINLIEANIDKLNTICLKHGVLELYAFGSAVSNAFHENSDIDLAVLFKDTLSPLEHGDAFFGLIDDLEALFKKPIDLVSYRALKNPIFISELDKTKVSLYAA